MTEDVLAGRDVGPRVVRGGAQRFAGFAVGNLLVAAGSVLLLRHLGPVEFGRYGIVMALVAIVLGITDAGLSITGTRELSVRPRGSSRRELLGTIVAMRMTLAVLGVGAAVVFALVAGYDSTLVLGTVVAGAGTVLIAVQGALALTLSVEMRNAALAGMELARQATFAVGIAVLALAGVGLLPFLALQIAVGAVSLALTPAVMGREGLVRPRWDASAWRDLALRALPVAVAAVLGVLYFRMLVLMVSLMASELETGYFVTSTRILELLAGVPLLLTGVALPVASVAAKQDRGRLRYVTQRLTEVAAVLGVLTAVMLLYVAEPVIVLLGGEEYRAAAPVLQLQGLAMITIFLVQAWIVCLVAVEAQRRLAWATAFGIVAVLVCGAILIPLADARGAGAAAAVADALLAVAMLLALRRAGPGRDLRWWFVPRVIAAGAIATAPWLLGLTGVAGAVVAALLFAAAALGLRLIPSEVIDAVRRR